MDYCNLASLSLLVWLLSLPSVWSGPEQGGKWLFMHSVSCWLWFFWELTVWFHSYIQLDISLRKTTKSERTNWLRIGQIWQISSVICGIITEVFLWCWWRVCAVFIYLLLLIKLTDWCTDFVCYNQWPLCPNSVFFCPFVCWLSGICFVFLSICPSSVDQHSCSRGRKKPEPHVTDDLTKNQPELNSDFRYNKPCFISQTSSNLK